MRRILHILATPEPDSFYAKIIQEQRADPALEITLFDLHQPKPDYDRLVDEIFKADSVQTW